MDAYYVYCGVYRGAYNDVFLELGGNSLVEEVLYGRYRWRVEEVVEELPHGDDEEEVVVVERKCHNKL